jgi:iron complex outermembrane receptor protein
MRLFTWQLGAFYKINMDHELRLTYARKNHFPTMSQRYSTRFGSTLPNPQLGPEIANHFEFGYKGYFFNALSLNAAAYYSIMDGKIVSIGIPDPNSPSKQVSYAVNLDQTAFWGFEFSPELSLWEWLNAGMAFSFNQYTLEKNLNGVNVLTYYPEITFNGYLVIKPLTMLSIIPRFEYIGSRYAESDGTLELDGYFLAHLKVSADIDKHVSLSASIENILDTYYEIQQYSPMAGRSFSLGLTVKY